MTAAELRAAVAAACRQYGAKVVSDAAYAAMSGHRAALTALGLQCLGNIPALDLAARVARELMSPEDEALDDAQAHIDAARIGARPGASRQPPLGLDGTE